MINKHPLFATIIVDYKSIQTTCNYIKNFSSHLIGHSNIIFVVVDNSVDENKITDEEFTKVDVLPTYKAAYNEIVEAISYRYKDHTVIYLKSKENSGYARGNNIGAEYLKNVLGIMPQYILFTNNDIELTKETSFSEVFEAFNTDKTIAAIGPYILEKKGNRTSPRKKISIFKLLVLYNINLILCNKIKKYVNDIEYTDDAKKVYWVLGCFMFVDTQKFFDVGMFDTSTFLYSEEMILAEKFGQKGYCMFYLPTLTVFHNHSQTINKYVKSNTNVKYLYETHRHYCKCYRNTSKATLILSDFVFYLYNVAFCVKRVIKGAIKK